MADKKLTPAALKLKQMTLKEMFECVELADREVKRFKRWFSKNYGMSTEDAPSGDIAHAIYCYCQERYTKRKADEVTYEKGKQVMYYLEGAEGPGFVMMGHIDVLQRAMVLDKKSWALRPETDQEFSDRVRRVSEFGGGASSDLRDMLEKRQGNCVAYTALYCMLAEEVGVDAKPFWVHRFEDDERQGLSAGKVARGEIGHVVAAFIKKTGKYLLFDPAKGIVNPKHEGRIIEKFMLYVAALSNKGCDLSRSGKHREGLMWINKALEIDPHDTKALSSKGGIYFVLKKPKKAIKYLKLALEEDGNNVSALSTLSAIYFNLDKPEKVAECLRRMLDVDPKNTDALHNMAVLLYSRASKGAESDEEKKRKYKEALGYVNRADDGRPFGLSLAFKVLILIRLGRTKEAQECLKIDDAEEIIKVCKEIEPEIQIPLTS